MLLLESLSGRRAEAGEWLGPATALTESFGSVEQWRAAFQAIGAARGVGWVILFQDPATNWLTNHWITLHQEGVPVGLRSESSTSRGRAGMKSRSGGPDSPLAGVRVLLVEDDAGVRQGIDRLLVGFGARVTAVAGVPEALDALPRARPNVLVSDIDLPGGDGYALIQRIRALPTDRGGQTPAVCLTGGDTAEDEAHVLGAGFQYCLAKPVDAWRLVTVVAALVVCRAWTAFEGFRGAEEGVRQQGYTI